MNSKNAEYIKKNLQKSKVKQKTYDEKNRILRNSKEAVKKMAVRNATTEKHRFDNYKQDIIHGTNFVCISCDRICFQK